MDAAKLQALGEYTAGISHKINNMLSIISGNAQYLLTRLKEKDLGSLTEEDIKEIRESLNIIMKRGDDCCAIAKKLLELIPR
jgi:signal transduction histidine kinase